MNKKISRSPISHLEMGHRMDDRGKVDKSADPIYAALVDGWMDGWMDGWKEIKVEDDVDGWMVDGF